MQTKNKIKQELESFCRTGGFQLTIKITVINDFSTSLCFAAINNSSQLDNRISRAGLHSKLMERKQPLLEALEQFRG